MEDGDHESEAPEVSLVPGLVDPRPLPTGLDQPDVKPSPADSNEAPDVDPPAWEGAEPKEAGRGLIDPRPEIPSPEGL